MATLKVSDEALLAFFQAHPNFRDRLGSIVGAVGNLDGDLAEADAAEERLVSRRCGFWAARRCKAGRMSGSRRQSGTFAAKPECIVRVKKLQWHTKFGEIKVLEPQYRHENKRVRPFILGAKVSPRGCSRPLQRAIVDFAADDPFARVPLKLKEHYGFEIGESTVQRITLGHAQAIFESSPPSGAFPQTPGQHKQIIAQIDGGMIPIMEPDANQKYKRKGKKLSWKEAKISLAHAEGNRTPVYGGGIEGGVETAGRRLLDCTVRAGFGTDSNLPAIGDGAPWIQGQIEEKFGDQASYLLDFYHVCEYLSPAAKAWMDAQKDALKTGRIDEVLGALALYREAPETSKEKAPIQACHRYLDARKDHLKYREALAEGLPIGSGEIESAHRYVVQKRLKLPGAWWRVENAEHMLALRINRQNGDWAELAASPPISTTPRSHSMPQLERTPLVRTP